MATYYNENDPNVVAWLRELIAAGLLPAGEVDDRSICDVKPSDLDGFGACHFFAGIGGWAYALRLACVPDDAPVWTGSCPCQPFSCAGRGAGAADKRHLWPEFLRLIAERRPATIFGEQVTSRLGREWLAGVFADLEGVDYAVAGADTCAASVGAPHIRQRLFWVADAANTDRRGRVSAAQAGAGANGIGRGRLTGGGSTGGLADALPAGRSERRTVAGRGQAAWGCAVGGVGNAGSTRLQERPQPQGGIAVGHEGQAADAPGVVGRVDYTAGSRYAPEGGGKSTEPKGRECLFGVGRDTGFWSAADWLPCLDGKARRVEPGTFPLAHGVSARVVRLRGYGNAIVPQLAAEFIRASLETLNA